MDQGFLVKPLLGINIRFCKNLYLCIGIHIFLLISHVFKTKIIYLICLWNTFEKLKKYIYLVLYLKFILIFPSMNLIVLQCSLTTLKESFYNTQDNMRPIWTNWLIILKQAYKIEIIITNYFVIIYYHFGNLIH